MISFAAFGNDLYTGKRSIQFIEHRRRWYAISAVLIVIALLGLGVQKLNLGLEFTGGSEFRVAQVQDTSDFETRATDVVESAASGREANVTKIGTSTIRVQTEQLDDDQSAQVRDALAEEFGVSGSNVSASFIGPSWGASLSEQALRALVVFLVLVSLVMALYFRTWTMAAAALVALVHDMVITVGIYALTGFEVSPATMIGFLTVLGYSLYDTVVVFDKVRENTNEAFAGKRVSYAQAANLAVNQTVVRSINTTVVALLPILAVLLVGFSTIGPGTLLDLSLVLFIGMGVGAYSSIFIATPVLAALKEREPAMQALARRVAARKGGDGGTGAKTAATAAPTRRAAAASGSGSGSTRWSGGSLANYEAERAEVDADDGDGDGLAEPAVAGAAGAGATVRPARSQGTRPAGGAQRNQPKRPTKNKPRKRR